MGISFLTERCGVAVFGLDLEALQRLIRGNPFLQPAVSLFLPAWAFLPPSSCPGGHLLGGSQQGMGLVRADDLGLADGLSNGFM